MKYPEIEIFISSNKEGLAIHQKNDILLFTKSQALTLYLELESFLYGDPAYAELQVENEDLRLTVECLQDKLEEAENTIESLDEQLYIARNG